MPIQAITGHAITIQAPRHLEHELLYQTLQGAVRFLGGINGAMMALSGT